MIMQVHDELVFEVPEDEVEWVRTEIPRLMAGVAELRCRCWPRSASGRTGTRRTDLLPRRGADSRAGDSEPQVVISIRVTAVPIAELAPSVTARSSAAEDL